MVNEQSMVYNPRTVILHTDIPEERPVSLFKQTINQAMEIPYASVFVFANIWYLAVLAFIIWMADRLLRVTTTYQNEWDIHQLVEQGHSDKLYRQGILIMYIEYGDKRDE